VNITTIICYGARKPTKHVCHSTCRFFEISKLQFHSNRKLAPLVFLQDKLHCTKQH